MFITKKSLFVFAGFLLQLLGFEAGAQSVPPASSGNGLLWRVTHPEMKQASYLFGTIHAICPEDYFFTESMQTAFDATQHLILEVDLENLDMAAGLSENMLLPEGKQFSDYFKDMETYERFVQLLRQNGNLDIEMFKGFKPFVLISALALQGFSCPTASSYEVNLNRMSKDKQMMVSGLETAEFQLQIFDRMPPEEIGEMLMAAVQTKDEGLKEDEKMVALYKQQDILGLYDLIKASGEFKGHEKEFLIGRNQNWVTKLPALMKEKPCFIAVGAGHLPGETGVVNLLRKQGYTVESVQ